jgi:GNAT superfamily N-acetyltransferase
MQRNIIRDLGDGLILRRTTVEDTEALVAFHADVHRDPGMEEPEEYVGAWVRDLMTRPHPTFDPGDFTIVEDTRTGAIISSLCLISQTWSYGGIRFGVGRPELVGTHPDYRRRGLIRAQFEVIHEWSAERGEMVQGITGIPWYYRQFGYEMALQLDGARAGYKLQVPKLKDGEQEPYRLRPATASDLAFMAQVYDYGCQRSQVACVRDEALWHYELAGRSEKNVNRQELLIIETVEAEPVGFLVHTPRLHRNRVGAPVYELKPGVSWLAVSPSVVRYLWALGEAWAAQDPKQEMERFIFWLGTEHPLYQVFHDGLPHTFKPYAWYLRVPDLAGFLQHVAPVLEGRLAQSLLVGHTGELRISFYCDGLHLAFDRGRLHIVEPWQPTPEKEGDAAFPDLTFLQLLFGYRSLPELRHAFADCWTANDRARSLLKALFPKQPSAVWWLS